MKRTYTTILVENQVYCSGTASWSEACPNEVAYRIVDGKSAGPGGTLGAAFAVYACADPEHRKRVAQGFMHPGEVPVKLAREYGYDG